MTNFADRMLSLLPEIYGESDASGDLKDFLSVVGPTLDELKYRIDQIIDLISPNDCLPDFLLYLAALLGAEYDPTYDPLPQRQRIQEAIERYRRKGTSSELSRELTRFSWDGEIIETFKFVLRLNHRSKLNNQKLPGRRYNHGIYGITDPLKYDVFLSITTQRQPAGTIMWLGEENNT